MTAKTTKFSQKVRNLKSHNTLERMGLATFDEARHKFFITPAGQQFAEEGRGIMSALSRQGFSERQRHIAQSRSFDNMVVEEGDYRDIDARVVRRSNLLRRFARRHFEDELGSVPCEVCHFRAE